MTTQFSSTLLGPSVSDGTLDFRADGIRWRSKTNSDKIIEIANKEVKVARWYDAGNSNSLWITDSSGQLQRFGGLRGSDQEAIKSTLDKLYGVKLSAGKVSAKGRNFASIRLRDGALELVGEDGGVMTPIPLSAISMAALPGRGEVEIQCAEDDTMDKEDECMLEMRLFVPDDVKLDGIERREGKASSGAGEDEHEEEDAGESAAQALHRAVTERAGISESGDKPLVELPEDVGQFLVPRGRFALELHPSYMRMIGGTYEFKIQYKSIARITYLPLPSNTGTHADATRFAIVISLDEPLRQGTQRHPHLVLNLDRKPFEVALNIPEEDVKAKKYEGLGADGAATVKAELPKLVGSLLKKITGKPVYKPETFESSTRQRAVRCTHKANGGLLFPLDKSCMFIHKPAVWIRYADVDSVNLERYAGTAAGSARTFDLTIKCKAGAGEPAREYVFQGLDRAERNPLVDFFKAKGMTVHDDSEGRKTNYAELDEELGSDEDEDEDDEGYGSDDAEREERKAAREDEDEDEDDEDEEEGGDDDDSDEGFRKRKSKSKAKPSKPAKKAKTAPAKAKGKAKGKKRRGSDEDDDDDDE